MFSIWLDLCEWQYCPVAGSCQNGTETLGRKEDGEFIDGVTISFQESFYSFNNIT
jgi:hypothetical protein